MERGKGVREELGPTSETRLPTGIGRHGEIAEAPPPAPFASGARPPPHPSAEAPRAGAGGGPQRQPTPPLGTLPRERQPSPPIPAPHLQPPGLGQPVHPTPPKERQAQPPPPQPQQPQPPQVHPQGQPQQPHPQLQPLPPHLAAVRTTHPIHLPLSSTEEPQRQGAWGREAGEGGTGAAAAAAAAGAAEGAVTVSISRAGMMVKPDSVFRLHVGVRPLSGELDHEALSRLHSSNQCYGLGELDHEALSRLHSSNQCYGMGEAGTWGVEAGIGSLLGHVLDGYDENGLAVLLAGLALIALSVVPNVSLQPLLGACAESVVRNKVRATLQPLLGGLLIAMGLVTGLHALVLFTAPGAIALVLLAAVHAAFGAWLLQAPSDHFLLIVSLWLAAQALSKLALAALWSLVSSYVALVVTAVVGIGLAGVAYFGFDADTPKWAHGVLVGGYLVLYGVSFLLIACMAYAGELGGHVQVGGVLVGGYLVLYGIAFLLIACMAYSGVGAGGAGGGYLVLYGVAFLLIACMAYAGEF
ncbi:unnamed protein product [Closterium sp. NIES-64]|nr:unnamed protein product [Closterium sp. NIES-64]